MWPQYRGQNGIENGDHGRAAPPSRTTEAMISEHPFYDRQKEIHVFLGVRRHHADSKSLPIEWYRRKLDVVDEYPGPVELTRHLLDVGVRRHIQRNDRGIGGCLDADSIEAASNVIDVVEQLPSQQR